LQSTINDFQYNRQMLKGFTNIDFSVPSQFGFEGSMVGEYHNFFLNCYVASSQSMAMFQGKTIDDLPLYRLLQAGSTSHVITQVTRQIGPKLVPVPPLDAEFYEMAFEDKVNNVRVYQLKNALPRAYTAASWTSLNDRDELLKRMADPRHSGFDPTKQTLVEGNTEAPAAQEAGIKPITIQSNQPERLQMNVEADVPSLLVLQDQYYPGWRVEIDGHVQPLLRCNGFMQGVAVPAGRHEVIFYYQPKSVIAGFALSLLAIVWCIALYVVARRPSRKADADGN
jgi:hypothetical protein